MAKLLKHLGLGGGGSRKSSASSSNSPQCDRVRQLFPEPGSPHSGHGSPPAVPSQHVLTDAETDSSATSTVSSANRSTVGSEDLPNPPSSWLNSSNSSVIISTNSSSTYIEGHCDGHATEHPASKMGNIYENQEVFGHAEKSPLFNERCWNEVKKWLQEMSNPTSLSTSAHQPTQSDIENARFLAEILSALQQARSEVFPSDPPSPSGSGSGGRAAGVSKGSDEVSGARSSTPGAARVGSMLTEVVMKLESEYERARKSLTSKDYERYTRLKELLRFEMQEPIYGLRDVQSGNHPEQVQRLSTCHNANMAESCFYDEPWNSDDVQVELEDQFQVSGGMTGSCGSGGGVLIGSSPSSSDQLQQLNFSQPLNSSVSPSFPHEVDARTRTGYELPWDWKPHQKDGRVEEGYDKPWDLKPHHKDSRPNKEYEEPWDHKGLKVESELMAAKMAKEAKASGFTEGDEGQQQQLQKKYKDLKQQPSSSSKTKDYEDPWDQKTKEIECDLIAAKIAKVTARIGIPSALTGKGPAVESSNLEGAAAKVTVGRVEVSGGDVAAGKKKPAVSISPSIHQQHQFHQQIHLQTAQQQQTPIQQQLPLQQQQQQQQFFSPFKKPLPPLPSSSSPSSLLSQMDSPRMRWSDAGRAVPSSGGGLPQIQAPLNEQIWYHGPIGRSEAENLLQKQKEAAFLIRRSENHPSDYSLSVRSNKGFMHLKIVSDPSGKFILGQFSQPFTSIPQMVQYYTSSKLPIKGAEHTSLLYPVPRNQP